MLSKFLFFSTYIHLNDITTYVENTYIETLCRCKSVQSDSPDVKESRQKANRAFNLLALQM